MGARGTGQGDREGSLAATTSKTELPAGMRAMTSRHRARAHAASWPATVAAGASLVSLAVSAVVILSLLWSPARELTYEYARERLLYYAHERRKTLQLSSFSPLRASV